MKKEVIQILVLCLFLSACNSSLNGEKLSNSDKLSVIDELTGQSETLSQVEFDQNFVKERTVASLSHHGMQAEIRFTDRQINLLGKINPKEFAHLQNALGPNNVITYEPTQRVIVVKGKNIPMNLAEVSELFLYKDLQSMREKRLQEFEVGHQLVEGKRFKELTVADRLLYSYVKNNNSLLLTYNLM